MDNTKSNKRISITAFEKIMDATRTQTKLVPWHDIEIEIKYSLTLKDVFNFVNTVTESCFTEDTNKYIPEVKDFVIKCCILELYANFTLPSHLERKYELVYGTDAVDTVVQHINNTQLREIIESINDKVDNIAQANVEAINRQMNELYAAFNNLQEQFMNIFSGIESDDFANLIKAASSGAIDEEKLVRAYVNYQGDTNDKAGD